MSQDILHKQIAEVREMMANRLRIRGRTLEAQVRKAGRLLPKGVRREATYLAQAATLMDHPKLAMMVDGDKATKAHARTTEFLASVDPKDRAKGRILNFLGAVSLGVIVLFVLVIWILVDRGLI